MELSGQGVAVARVGGWAAQFAALPPVLTCPVEALGRRWQLEIVGPDESSSSRRSGRASALAGGGFVGIYLSLLEGAPVFARVILTLTCADPADSESYSPSEVVKFQPKDPSSISTSTSSSTSPTAFKDAGCDRFLPLSALAPDGGFCVDDSICIKIDLQPRAEHAEREREVENLSILIIEDSETQQKLMLRSLKVANSNWQLKGCTSAEAAIALLESGSYFDVLLVDQNLSVNEGGMSGTDFVSQLRQNAKYNSVVIIGCSSNAAKHASDLIRAGCDACWPKPLPPQHELLEYILSAKYFRQLLQSPTVSSNGSVASCVRSDNSSVNNSNSICGESYGIASDRCVVSDMFADCGSVLDDSKSSVSPSDAAPLTVFSIAHDITKNRYGLSNSNSNASGKVNKSSSRVPGGGKATQSASQFYSSPDVILVSSEGVRIPAHRLLLAVLSERFAGLFFGMGGVYGHSGKLTGGSSSMKAKGMVRNNSSNSGSVESKSGRESALSISNTSASDGPGSSSATSEASRKKAKVGEIDTSLPPPIQQTIEVMSPSGTLYLQELSLPDLSVDILQEFVRFSYANDCR